MPMISRRCFARQRSKLRTNTFLDPFEKEFDYSKGKSTWKQLSELSSRRGVLECVQLVFSSIRLAGRLKEKPEEWFRCTAKI
jgi:hypothetical protein